MQSFDVGFAEPERSELGGHLFAARVCPAQTRSDVSAAKCYRSEDSELDENGQIEYGDTIDDRHREIEDVAQHGDEQHAGRGQQQCADGDDQDVERSELRRRASLGDVHNGRHQQQIEDHLQIEEAIARGLLFSRGIQY